MAALGSLGVVFNFIVLTPIRNVFPAGVVYGDEMLFLLLWVLSSIGLLLLYLVFEDSKSREVRMLVLVVPLVLSVIAAVPLVQLGYSDLYWRPESQLQIGLWMSAGPFAWTAVFLPLAGSMSYYFLAFVPEEFLTRLRKIEIVHR